MVGEDPESKVYVRNKSKACNEAGIAYEEFLLDENSSMEELLKVIKELNERKIIGGKLKWDNITREELEELYKKYSDNIIAELYGVSKSQVKYKRDKWNIKLRNYSIDNFLSSDEFKIILKELNQKSKKRLLNKDNFDDISIALTHYLFRNGPVEDMHSEGKLSQEDMKTLNKFMVNRISGLLKTINDGDWLTLESLFNYYKRFGIDWDKPIPDTEEMNYFSYRNKIKRGIESEKYNI